MKPKKNIFTRAMSQPQIILPIEDFIYSDIFITLLYYYSFNKKLPFILFTIFNSSNNLFLSLFNH